MAVKIALAGNPNCGKTTLFNALTGSNQFVGNWPGVTVEKKEGKLKGHKDVVIMDLPGIYSLSPYTLEEVVARNYLIGDRPDAILNIVDGTNIERNLYLSTQLMELGIPVIMAINMMDLVEKNGDKIHIDKLSRKLGCEVVEISALKGTGIQKAAEKAVALAQQKKNMVPVHEFSKDAEDVITEVENKLSGIVSEDQKRFFAIKLLEKDDKIKEQMKSVPDVSYEIKEMEDKFDDDTESIITNERYVYISSIIGECVSKSSKEKLTTSDKIDRIVTNRWLAIPIFAVVMFLVYYVSVTTVGTFVTDWTNDVFVVAVQDFFSNILGSIGAGDMVQGLVVDGIIGGLGAVLGFVPQMAILFLFLSILEDCGYMVRIAFVMDRVFRHFGLSGKSFIPLLISSGCGIPGIMASKTIEQDNDRRLTIMTATFIPCGAKLPVIALMGGVIAGETAGYAESSFIAPLMYFIGIVAVLVAAIILKKTKPFSGKPAPFVMELPQYHIPSAKTVLLHVWERLKGFIIKAGTILFLATVIMWVLSSIGTTGSGIGFVEDSNDSIMAILGGILAPIFAPLGWTKAGEGWKMAVAAITGLIAKENVVATFGMLFGFAEVAEDGTEFWGNLAAVMTPVAAYGYLVFNLLCAPCFAAMGAIKREMNNAKWFWFAIGYQCGLAYVVSLCIYQIGTLLTGGGFGIGTVVAFVLVAAFLYLLFRPYKESNSLKVNTKSIA